MFSPALRRRVRGASRIQTRSFLCPSTRNARNVIAVAAQCGHEEGSNGSKQSNNSSGQDQRNGGHLPLRSTAVAGVSMLAGAATSDDSNKATPPPYALRDPSGWGCLDNNPSIVMDFIMRVRQAMDTKSVEEARSAQFDFTRAYMELAVYGDVIDEGPLPDDIIFGAGLHVKKEDTKLFWVPSTELGKSSILCLSVHYDLNDGERLGLFLTTALESGMFERLLEKFKEDECIHFHVHFSTVFFSIGIDRDVVLGLLERGKSLSSTQK